jgi:hypothetical protein
VLIRELNARVNEHSVLVREVNDRVNELSVLIRELNARVNKANDRTGQYIADTWDKTQ